LIGAPTPVARGRIPGILDIDQMLVGIQSKAVAERMR
jgi:hypothetical protein